MGKNRRNSVNELKGSSGKTTSNRISSKYSISQNKQYVNYVNIDNKGTKLSQQQQEYFKDGSLYHK